MIQHLAGQGTGSTFSSEQLTWIGGMCISAGNTLLTHDLIASAHRLGWSKLMDSDVEFGVALLPAETEVQEIICSSHVEWSRVPTN